jgi:hypothetical protein
MIITTENLIENLPKLGGWSLFSLAESAIQHYFPSEFDENDYCETRRVVELMRKLGCITWIQVIEKYHTEVGYKPEGGVFNVEAVNEN